LARKPNYGHEKRQREIRKQKKKAQKAEMKRLKAEQDSDSALPPEGTAPEGDEPE
jgi:hypothetical protein